jgi:hypothetical protein
MADGDEDRLFIQSVKRRRDALLEQIRQSQHAIERSKQLLQQMDEIIARSATKGESGG